MNFKQGNISTRRRRAFVVLGVVACIAGVAFAAVAGATHLQAGSVLTGEAKDNNGKAYYDITFKVKSEHTIQKIVAIQHVKAADAGKRCLLPQNFSFKTVHVDSDGTFQAHTSGYMFHATVDGRFKSSGKAHGHLTACTPGLVYTVKK